MCVSSVLVKYSGYLEHMDKPFDSNCFRKTPRLMKLGEGEFRLEAGKEGVARGADEGRCPGTEKLARAQILGVGLSEAGFLLNQLCSLPHSPWRPRYLGDGPPGKLMFAFQT